MSDTDLAATRRALREILNEEPPPPMLRSAFDALSPAKQAAFCKLGGKIVNDPKPPRRLVPPQAGYQMTRADYLQAEAADKLRSARD